MAFARYSIRHFVALSLSLVSLTVEAAGFRLPEYSIYGIATANAIVARDDAAALSLNPAAMGFLEGTQLSANMYHLTYDLEVTTTTNNNTAQNVGEDAFNIPGLYVMTPINKDMAFGFSVHVPFGLETKWPDNTFTGFLGVNALDTEVSRIKMVNYNPNLSYRLNENTSIAFGIDYYEVQELVFNTYGVAINGSGDGVGWNAALQSHHGPLSVGVSYHHSIGTSLQGNYNRTGNIPIRASLNLPSMLQLGIHYQISDVVGFEFDYERIGWSSFSSLEIVRTSDDGVQTTSTNNWHDSNSYRSNLQFKLGSASELNFGLAYDETPQSDEYYSARIADSDRILYSLGYRHKFSNFSVDVGFMRVVFKERNYTGQKSYTPGVSEPNGSTVYNGSYRAQADLFGLGINYKF